jgi:NitT/TauT family transport system permease protein
MSSPPSLHIKSVDQGLKVCLSDRSSVPALSSDRAERLPESGAKGDALLWFMEDLRWQGVSFALVFGCWELVGRAQLNLAFPPISSVAAALFEMIKDGRLAHAYLETLPPLVFGVVMASAAGTLAGILMGLSRHAEALFYPFFILLQTAPMAALIPFITQVVGVSTAAKTLSVIALSMPIVALNSFKGTRDTNPTLIEMCRSLTGSRYQEITKIILPSASPILFAGLRLSVSGGFIGIVLAELLITPTGIGDLISYNSSIAH